MTEETAVELEMLARGLRRVTYIETFCKLCGCFRVGVDGELDATADRFPCPICGIARAGAAIARGFTSLAIPIITRVHGPLWEQSEARLRSGIKTRWRPKPCRYSPFCAPAPSLSAEDVSRAAALMRKDKDAHPQAVNVSGSL